MLFVKDSWASLGHFIIIYSGFVNLRFLHDSILGLSWLGNLFQTMISETNVSSFPFEISRMELHHS